MELQPPIPMTVSETLLALDVGQSKEIPAPKIRSWRTAACRIKDRQFTSRREGDGYRMWRLS